MKLQKDLREFIELLISKKVEFVIVGGWAYNLYANPRATGDIDFFVSRSIENQNRIREVLVEFGYATTLPPEDEELIKERKVLMLGRKPNRIDLLSHIDGVQFEEAYNTKVYGNLDNLKVPFLAIDLLIKNKSSTGREKDEVDVKYLKQL
jgi:hypothetical protein